MFKRLKQIKNIVDKVTIAKDFLKQEIVQNSECQGSSGTIKIIHQSAIKLMQQIAAEGKEILTEDDRFYSAVDSAYDNLPIQIRIVLRKKRFRKIMLRVKEKYLADKEKYKEDASTMKIIEESMSEAHEI